MKPFLKIIFFVVAINSSVKAQYAEALSQTAMSLWKDSFALEAPGKPVKWSYDLGVILKGIEGVWMATGDVQYFNYIQKMMDFYVQKDGSSIKAYKQQDYNIDHINNGKNLLFLYRVTGRDKYRKAASLLREQLVSHPRTQLNTFWHKKIYTHQMWLDGLYMGQPFYAEWAALFNEPEVFNDVTRQFVVMEQVARDEKTGLLLHGWDESREQRWADKTTGKSPNVWGRALGWYGMAMVDALDYFPENHKGKDSIIQILNRFTKAIVQYQDPATGLWYDVVDKMDEPRNYLESSAAAMLVYTMVKGVRKGYLPESYMPQAMKAYNSIIQKFLRKNANGLYDWEGTVKVSGLGGTKNYRDGSFDYYMSEPVITNDPKGLGAFIKCAVEVEAWQNAQKYKPSTVVLDNYFNNEFKKYPNGTEYSYHYTWNDRANSGFHVWGNLFERAGATLKTLKEAPKKKNLKNANVYIIVDPDDEKETAQPNFISANDIKQIKNWVKKGGSLVLMANDTGNVELKQFNQLASEFGVSFNYDSKNRVKNNQFEEGLVTVNENNPIFKNAKRLFIKEYSSLKVNEPAKSIVQKNGDHVIAITQYKKGKVFIIGDPWLYNEYVDGRKLPASFQNHAAAVDLIDWLLTR